MQVEDPAQEALRIFADNSVPFAIRWFARGIGPELRMQMFQALSYDLNNIRRRFPNQTILLRSVMIALADKISNSDLSYRDFLCEFFQNWAARYGAAAVGDFRFKEYIKTQRMAGQFIQVMIPLPRFVVFSEMLRH